LEEVVAFAVANATSGNIWALFVHPDHERRGYGRLLHDTMVSWLWATGLERLLLTTEPGTRAHMTLEPILNAPIAVQLHVITVLPAFVIGTWLIFFSRKGSRHHKLLGKTFLGLMVATSLLSFLVHERRPENPLFGLSPIHILAAFVLFASWRAYSAVKAGDVATHRIWMLGIYTGSLVINGAMNVFVVDGITRDVFFDG
jgi:uncharacterized membrane protein